MLEEDVVKRLKKKEDVENTLSDAITFNKIIEIKLGLELSKEEKFRQLRKCKKEIDTLIEAMTSIKEENRILIEHLKEDLI
jgi:hypothetical protein